MCACVVAHTYHTEALLLKKSFAFVLLRFYSHAFVGTNQRRTKRQRGRQDTSGLQPVLPRTRAPQVWVADRHGALPAGGATSWPSRGDPQHGGAWTGWHRHHRGVSTDTGLSSRWPARCAADPPSYPPATPTPYAGIARRCCLRSRRGKTLPQSPWRAGLP